MLILGHPILYCALAGGGERDIEPKVNYYELLGLDRNASQTQIRAAYRSLAKVMHPDAGGTAGTFRVLQEAYETLTDPERRAEYDSEFTESPVVTKEPPVRPFLRRRMFGDDPDFVAKPARLNPDSIPWWRWTPAGERVRHIPAVGYGHAPVFAAFGGWLAIVLLGVVAIASLVLFLVWLVVVVVFGYVVLRLVRGLIRARRADQEFREEYGERIIFGLPSKENMAELLTADLLVRYLTRLPGVRIFHGLKWPDSVFADVDHAVLCGRRLVLIESKTWLPGHYTSDEHGRIWRNGHVFRGGDIRLPESVDVFRGLLTDIEVRAALLIYPSRNGEITTGASEAEVPPMNPEQFVRDIGEWLALDPSTVDRDVFRTVLAQVVAE